MNRPPFLNSMKQAAAAWGIPVAVLRAAKSAGCPAFRNKRVHREVVEWLETHPEVSAQVDRAAREKSELEALRRRRLELQVERLELQAARENGSMVSRERVKSAYAKAVAAVLEEAALLLSPEDCRVFCIRTKARIAEPAPNEIQTCES